MFVQRPDCRPRRGGLDVMITDRQRTETMRWRRLLDFGTGYLDAVVAIFAAACLIMSTTGFGFDT